MRFKGYIVENLGPTGGRGRAIGEEEAIDTLKTKCKKSFGLYMKTGDVLLRGARFKGHYQILDPKKSARRSQYTDNYYTMILDNDPRWKKYPKRSEALVCTTDKYKAEGYGNTMYHIFAFDGANYGVCPASDIWESFKNTMGSIDLGKMNRELNDIAEYFEIKGFRDVNKYKHFIWNLEDMEEHIDRMMTDYYDDKAKEGERAFVPTRIRDSDLFYKWDKKSSFKDFIISLYDPDKNGFFATKNPADIFSKGVRNKEVWTDSKCLIIVDNFLDYTTI